VVVEPSPENHFLPGPNRSYALTIGRRVGRIGRSPGVGRGVIASTGRHGRGASLDDHFASTPDRRVHPAEGRRTGHAGWGPGIRGRVIAGAALVVIGIIEAAPHNHLRARPHCAVKVAGGWGVRGGQARPNIGDRVVPRTVSVELADAAVVSAPDDHLRAGPYRGVKSARDRSVPDIGKRPGIGGGVVAPA